MASKVTVVSFLNQFEYQGLQILLGKTMKKEPVELKNS